MGTLFLATRLVAVPRESGPLIYLEPLPASAESRLYDFLVRP